MRRAEEERSPLKLSICISTRNRAAFIGETLESIIVQATSDCEIVVLDAASTDDTERVVSMYAAGFENLRYVRQETNNGFDRDFDHAVELAEGEYCWLMPDDDRLKQGAVAAVLQAINHDYSLVLVNVEYTNFDMSVVRKGALDIDCSEDREYGPGEIDALFETTWKLIRYVGCIVIKRAIWLGRDRARYFESSFIHVGVIFQKQLPGLTLLIAMPSISVRLENQSWLSKWFEIFFVRWPSCVSSLALSESAKRKALGDELWKRCGLLLQARAAGQYSLAEYRQSVRSHLRSFRQRLCPTLVAVLPGMLLNAILVVHYSILDRSNRRTPLLMLKQSRFYLLRRRGVSTDS